MTFNIFDIEVKRRGRTITVKGDIGYGPNYTFTGESKVVNGITVYQIVAIDDVYTAVPGTLGGWVSSPNCLSQEDRSWIDQDTILIGSRVSGTSYIGGITTVVNSIIKDTLINESSKDLCDNTLRITDSDLTKVVFTGEGTIYKSNLSHVKVNEVIVPLSDVILKSSVLSKLSISSEYLEIIKSSLDSLDITARGKMSEINLCGLISATKRPEIYLESDFPEECCGINYSGYLPLGLYDDSNIISTLSGAKKVVDNKRAETALRPDIESFINSL